MYEINKTKTSFLVTTCTSTSLGTRNFHQNRSQKINHADHRNVNSIMPTKSTESHSFNHADRQHREHLSQPFIQSWMANCCCKPHAAACCAHNFSSSKLSTSFATKPPCRPILRPPLAGRLLYYRRLPTTFTRKHRHRLEAGTAANDCSR